MKQNSLFLLCVGGVAGAAAACATLHDIQRRQWNARSRQYDQASHAQESSLKSVVAPNSGTGLHNFHEDEILAEQFTRNVQFFGQQGQIKIANAFVVVIGLGVCCQSLCS
jgi:hypothetical protein